ncbi:ecdysteroid-phosphate phosphatase-like isoform X1 [Centruroides vittatus]|uniref:ecdysteroid-phosphate phosphatase-like isoform X1 n=1 Tax=Centruroides vittatus TaxID=120091 RepID=UPI00350FC0D1
MAALPPRRSISSSKANRQLLSHLQILLQMGFPKHRAEKALAATGDRGVQLAADWLLAHVNDVTLDGDTPREYILYLCPTGPLQEQLQDFFSLSLVQCGRNGAHNYLPHITLCSFFQAPDNSISHLVRALKHVVEKLRHELPDRICLEHYTSSTFLGLFVADQHNDLLKRLAVQFMREVSEYIVTEMGALDVLGTCFPWCSSSYPSLTKGGSRRRIQVEPYLKALHITLAYQFQPEHYSTLERLTKDIDTDAAACWELRLYSRDTRIKGNEVHKVLYSHVPQEQDELELLIGDYVYVNADQINSSVDGWVEGTSWLTGCTGFLPINYIERAAESDAWTLHRSVPLSKNIPPDNTEDNFISKRLLQQNSDTKQSPKLHRHLQPYEEEELLNSPKHSPHSKELSFTNSGNTNSIRFKREDRKQMPRQLFVIRHAERVDFTFGSWIPICFDSTGNYVKKDLNMPNIVPPRKGGPQDYLKDSPLTKIGLYQASLTGEALKESAVEFTYVYSSPSLRCLQTCTNILRALGQQYLKINVEPGLFEWLAWYQEGMPTWMSVQELSDYGFNVNLDYQPLIAADELKDKREAIEQYYLRSFYIVKTIIKNTENGNILLLGHSASLDSCTRQLIGLAPRSTSDLIRVIRKTPYCAITVAEEDTDGKWNLVAPPVLPLVHSANGQHDWKTLLT